MGDVCGPSFPSHLSPVSASGSYQRYRISNPAKPIVKRRPKIQESAHQVVLIDHGHTVPTQFNHSPKKHSEPQSNEAQSASPTSHSRDAVQVVVNEPVDFVEIAPASTAEPQVAVETRIDVIRMTDHRGTDEQIASDEASQSDSKPMDEALITCFANCVTLSKGKQHDSLAICTDTTSDCHCGPSIIGLGHGARCPIRDRAQLGNRDGFQVDIKETRVGLFPPRIHFSEVQVADPRDDKEMRDAFRADSIDLVMDGNACFIAAGCEKRDHLWS